MSQQRQHPVCSEQPNRTAVMSSGLASPDGNQPPEKQTEPTLLSGFASQAAATSGGEGRMCSLGRFKDAARIALLVHPTPKHDAHPRIRQRPHGHRMALALRPFAVVIVLGPG